MSCFLGFYDIVSLVLVEPFIVEDLHPLESLDDEVYSVELSRYVDMLRAVRFALFAVDAVVGLSLAWYSSVVVDEEASFGGEVVGVGLVGDDISSVEALVVVSEDSGYVESVGARHAVLACGAGHDGERYIVDCHFL